MERKRKREIKAPKGSPQQLSTTKTAWSFIPKATQVKLEKKPVQYPSYFLIVLTEVPFWEGIKAFNSESQNKHKTIPFQSF